MSLEETIQTLSDSAAEQETKLARLERNSALLDQALRRLLERQKLLEMWAVEVQAVLDDLDQRRFHHHRRKLNATRKADAPLYAHCRPAKRPARKN